MQSPQARCSRSARRLQVTCGGALWYSFPELIRQRGALRSEMDPQISASQKLRAESAKLRREFREAVNRTCDLAERIKAKRSALPDSRHDPTNPLAIAGVMRSDW